MLHKALAAAALSLFLAIEAQAGSPEPLSASQLLDICSSPTVSEAASKGDALGWQRMSDEQTAEWRTSFVAYNGGSVELVGWQRGEAGSDSLSFWVAKGPNGHRACSHSAANPDGLLDGLTERFGAPDTLDEYAFGTVAYWKQSGREVSFSSVGSSAGVTISFKP